jgi:hypothetical protein
VPPPVPSAGTKTYSKPDPNILEIKSSEITSSFVSWRQRRHRH